jgi:hypothetical protein
LLAASVTARDPQQTWAWQYADGASEAQSRPSTVNGLLTNAAQPAVIGHHKPITAPIRSRRTAMSVETLTYAALGARLKISREAARSLARRLRLPRSLSDDGKALVSVDLAEIRHTPHPPVGRQAGHVALLTAKIEALEAEIARLEARADDQSADFGRERERADRLTAELLQANAETMAANETTAGLEAELAALRSGGRAGGSIDSHGQAARRLGHLAATIVEADRKACR